MANPIDKVRSSFNAGRREMVVPEWDDLHIYFTPITVAEWESVEARKPRGEQDRQLLLLVAKARDEKGKPLFAYGDMNTLRTEAAFNVIQRVITFMWEGIPTEKEAEKELEANPTSTGA